MKEVDRIKKLNTIKVIENYIDILKYNSNNIRPLINYTTPEDLIRLLEEAVDKYDEFLKLDADNSKVNRWIGYVQGVLIQSGYLTVQGERDYTRKYFTAHRDLVKKKGEINAK